MTMRTNFGGELGREYDQANQATRANQQWYGAQVDTLKGLRTAALQELFDANLAGAAMAWREAGFVLPFSHELPLTENLPPMGVSRAAIEIVGQSTYSVFLVSKQDSTTVNDAGGGSYTAAMEAELAKE